MSTSLIKMEIDTLLGEYQPFGAHATAIYETMWEMGLFYPFTDKLTPFGEEVKKFYENERRKGSGKTGDNSKGSSV